MIDYIGYFFLVNLVALPLMGLIYVEALLGIVLIAHIRELYIKWKEKRNA